MTGGRVVSVLIGALGGQGGGVLTSWLVEAAHLAGFPAQATSIPGVAQRTGATTYYFEIYPQKHPPAEPIFSLFPSSGAVDLVAALEPTEAGRAMAAGFITRATTVVTSTARVYSTAEKSVAGHGDIPAGDILQALDHAAGKLLLVEPGASGMLNARLFGALLGTGILPLTPEDGLAAIEHLGLAVEANLSGFREGLALLENPAPPIGKSAGFEMEGPPPVLQDDLNALPERLRPLAGHAAARLVDYQDVDYARFYLQRLHTIIDLEDPNTGYPISLEVAKRLAAWMSHEDVIRVAQLKTRQDRLDHIRKDLGAQPSEPVRVIDFFSPGWEEVAGVLPGGLGRWAASRGQGALHLAWPTSSPWGYAALRFLAGLRFLRRHTTAFKEEQNLIETWLAAVRSAMALDPAFGVHVAELAVWARGYGDVRRRGLDCLKTLFKQWEDRIEEDLTSLKDEVRASLHQARHNPDQPCQGALK